jgi:hypothetical protein
VEFAQHQFQLAKKQADGRSLRDHLESVQRQTGRTPPELVGPTLLPMCSHWWAWWHELAEGRQQGLALSTFAWSEIGHWAQLTKRDIDPVDVAALRAIDRAFIEINTQSKPAEGRRK